MSKETPNEELEREFSDADSALSVGTDSDAEPSGEDRDQEQFQKEYKAIFEDDAAEEKESGKELFLVSDPDGMASGFYDWVRCVLVAVSIVVVCLTFVFRLVEVDGKSMMDTLENTDKVLVTDLFYQPHNNDVIIISHAKEHKDPLIKRVIAVGGQTVKLDYDNDKVFVDGIELTEPYVKDGISLTEESKGKSKHLGINEDGNFVVPEGKLFVMGDNRQKSLDSRYPSIDFIPVENVIGKAQFVVFPFNHFGNVYDK